MKQGVSSTLFFSIATYKNNILEMGARWKGSMLADINKAVYEENGFKCHAVSQVCKNVKYVHGIENYSCVY